MKKTKTEKGITLIALLVTVSVLVILATVTISSIVNDGIISKAENAVEQYNQAQFNEQNSLNYYDNYLQNNGKTTLTNEQISEMASNGFTVTKYGVLTAYTGSATTINIPYGVRRIQSGVFKGNKTITSITFPGTLTDIPNAEFASCTSLTQVNLHTGIKDTVVVNSFYEATISNNFNNVNCSPWFNSKCVQDSAGFTTYNDILVHASSNVKGDVTIPNGVRIIGKSAFFFAGYINTLTIPQNVQYIYNGGLYQTVGGIATINIYRKEGALAGSPWGAKNFNSSTGTTQNTVINWVGAN